MAGRSRPRQLSLKNACRGTARVLEGEISRKVLTQELAKDKLQVTQQDLDEEVARAAEMYGVVDKDGKPDVQRWLKQITEQDKAGTTLYPRRGVALGRAQRRSSAARLRLPKTT